MHPLLIPIKPTKRENIIDLAAKAGLNVSDWSNFNGSASKNPKYCYQWAFTQDNLIILNLWFKNLKLKNGHVVQTLNMKQKAAREEKATWKSRALKADQAIHSAYVLQLPIRVIICDGKLRTNTTKSVEASKVKARMLDPILWAVAYYNYKTGECIIQRGLTPIKPKDQPELSYDDYAGFEGELRKRFIKYRKREKRLRNLKILDSLEKNRGHLYCEVPGCGFDFAHVYGEVGKNYAEVHHKFPLGKSDRKGQETKLADLSIVCSNCHAMIHRGGHCRAIESLIN